MFQSVVVQQGLELYGSSWRRTKVRRAYDRDPTA